MFVIYSHDDGYLKYFSKCEKGDKEFPDWPMQFGFYYPSESRWMVPGTVSLDD